MIMGEPVHLPESVFGFMDRPSSRYWRDEFDAHRVAGGAYAAVEDASDSVIARLGQGVQAIATANVVKRWADELSMLLHLTHHAATVVAREHSLPLGHVFVITPSVALASGHGESEDGAPVVIWQQSMRVGSLLGVATLALASCRVLRAFLPGRSLSLEQACVAVAAVWGPRPGRANDLFWWWKSGIAPRRILYMLDAEAHPADSVDAVRKLGIRAAALRPGLDRQPLQRLRYAKPPVREALEDLKLAVSLTMRSWRSAGKVRAGLTLLAWHHVMARRLSAQLATAGVRALFHYQESHADYYGHAAELSGGVRIGVPWSSLAAPCSCAIRTHHVFFCWGSRDASLYLDAGAVTGHLLIAGCSVLEMRASEEAREAAHDAAERTRRRGAKIVLALFDTNFTPDFYQSFLSWVVDSPYVGLLIKSKATGWALAKADGLGGLVARGLETGRVLALSENLTPSDAAAAADFAIGCVSQSAVIVSAVAGSRILYVDYERLDNGPLQPYATLHSLGPDRCVFYDTDSLRAAVERYWTDPEANPLLGDVSPILDQLDPFRDGQASLRVGEYVRWYLEAIDAGFDREASLRSATKQYADKWGSDKVVRGL